MISEWTDFEFYDRVWFYDQKKIEIDGSGRRLARWLGVAHRVGSNLCYWLLLPTGNVIARTTVQHVTREDHLNNDIRNDIETFDKSVDNRLKEEGFLTEDAGDMSFFLQDEDPEYAGVTTSNQVPTELGEYGDMTTPDAPEADDMKDDIMDKYLNVELIMDVGSGSERKGRVLKRAKGSTGEPIGRAHANPLFDTRE